MTCTDLCTDLLPPEAPLQIETMAMTEGGMTLDVAVTTSQALCPTCTQPSTHMHSDYRRTLADLPWATTPVQLHLRVRCSNLDTVSFTYMRSPADCVLRAHPRPPSNFGRREEGGNHSTAHRATRCFYCA